MEKRTADICHERLDMLLTLALKNRVFTGCSVGYIRINEKVKEGALLHYGYTGEGKNTSAVDERTVFDLASLTKPLATSLSLLTLIEEKKIKIEENIDTFLKVRVPEHKKIKIFHLLTHSSGLPAHRLFYKKLLSVSSDKRMDTLISSILSEDLMYKPGTQNIYSDLGFMLLGRIVEKVSGYSLDDYWRRNIALPLDLDNDLFFASTQKKGFRVYAGTGECNWSKTRLSGVVHDDNCRALGGVAGHAGLFGTAKAVLALCENILLQYKGRRQSSSYSSENLRTALNSSKGNWRFGFDMPSAFLSSSGKYFSDDSIGHLGFTGTSFWIDLQREIAIVFFTNRVFYGDDLVAIKKVRPLLHDTIMEYLIPMHGK